MPCRHWNNFFETKKEEGVSYLMAAISLLNTQNPTSLSQQISRKRLGDILVEQNLITKEQLEMALAVQKQNKKVKLGEILISRHLITETALAERLADQLDIPFYQLDQIKPSFDAIKCMSKEQAIRMQAIPLSFVNRVLVIAMVNPQDLNARDAIKMSTSCDKLEPGITTPTDIRNHIDRFYDMQNNMMAAVEESELFAKRFSRDDVKNESNEKSAPVVALAWNFIRQAVRDRASDIHIEIDDRDGGCIRFRVDGQLSVVNSYPASLHPSLSSRFKIMSGMDIAEKRKPQDGRIQIMVDGRNVDFRVSSLPTRAGEKIVLRVLDQDAANVGLGKLGLNDIDIKMLKTFANMPNGIFLVTGPTGSGKSMTLYSMISEINNRNLNITTVEDPVEFTIRGVNQVHVDEKAGMTFDSALRAILRQDPDKIMIGEIRDFTTAEIAIRAALTGHLVLSTLHTNDAASAVTRLVDMGIPPYLVSASLVGVVAQRLVRRLCPHCKHATNLDEHTAQSVGLPTGTPIWEPVGCRECRDGYSGRMGIFEILYITPEIKTMIVKNTSDLEIKDFAMASSEYRMNSLRQSGLNAVIRGDTSLAEVLSVTI